MQTFVPMGNNHGLTAKALDMRRLGKQRVEAWQILRTLTGESDGWRNHPAVKMWAGYEKELCAYGFAICNEWRSRGYKDTLMDRFILSIPRIGTPFRTPDWLSDPSVALSHKSNLIRKFPEHYRPLWSDVPDDLPYVWPV